MCPWCGSGLHGMWGWGMMAMWLVIALVVGGAIWTWSRNARGGDRSSRGVAEELLRERYARGEIDDATYQRMLAQLGDHGVRS